MKITFSILSITLSIHLLALSNEDVSVKSYKATSDYVSEEAHMEMILKNSAGETNQRNLSMKKLEGDNGDKTLMEFNSPADVKGTVLLTHEHLEKDDEQWLYMPGLKKTKRIISKNKSGSFMGSEFSYEDLSSQHYKKYTYNSNAEEINVAGVKYYKSVRIPIDPNSGYSKQILLVDAKTFLIHKIEYFDKNGVLLKIGYFPEYKKLETVWRNTKIIMKNVQTNKETTLDWINEKINAGYTSKDFSQSILQN